MTVKVTDPDDPSYTVDHEIDIDAIKVSKNKDHSDIVVIDDKTQIKMKYPDIQFFAEGINVTSITDRLDVAARCVKQLVIDEEVYNPSDMTLDEIEEWLEGLTSDQFAKIMNFFMSMPRLSHKITLSNPNTGKKFSVTLEGLSDFF